MADINNPEAIAFANEKVRPSADKFAQAYYQAKIVVAEWNANNMGSLFPLGDTVQDGAASDGRHPITGNDVVVLINLLNEYIGYFEASNNQDINGLLNIAVNVKP